MKTEVRVWGPATVANWGPGYDLMGAAVEGMGDIVTARVVTSHQGIRITSIQGDGGKLPTAPDKNTAGIAATETLKLLGREDLGIELHIEKGLPLGSGLGSSGASAVAAAYAVNLLCGSPVEKGALMPALLAAESAVSGWHADNVAPALLGGFVLVYSYKPLSFLTLPTPASLWVTLVTPDLIINTRDARAVVPTHIPLAAHVANAGHLGAFVSALYQDDIPLLGRALQDQIVVPARTPLLTGFLEVQQAALDAGAYGCSISGAGPTVFAISQDQEKAVAISLAMKQTFADVAGLDSKAHTARIDATGAREIKTG